MFNALRMRFIAAFNMCGPDLQSAVPFDAQAFANQIQSTATVTQDYVTGVDSNYIQTTMTNYQAQIQNYINQNMPNATVGDIIGKKEIKKQEFGILPVTLPYKVITVGAKYSEVPDNLRHKVTFEVQDDASTGPSISYTVSIPEVAGKRLTISYAPASAADQQAIDSYGGIFNTPAYLINMAPQIKIEGVTMATGNSIGLGNQETFNMNFQSPSGTNDSVVSNTVTVGAYYGIGVDPSKITQAVIDKRRAKLSAVQSTVSDTTIYTDDYIGELIYATALAYFFELDELTNVIAQKYKIADLKHVSEAIVSKDVDVTSLYGVPTAVTDASMTIDVDRLIHSAVSQNGDQTKEFQFTVVAGQMSSAIEHGIFEQMYQAKGVSTIQVLQLANSQGIPIYTITPNNISSVLPQLQVSSDVITDIQNAVNAGENIVIPQQNIIYYGWTGTGYIVMDPSTGSGAYMISTSLAGGGHCLAAGGLSVIMLASAGSSSSGTGGPGSCSISLLTPIHWIEVLDFLVPLGAALAGMNVMLDLYSAWVIAGSALTFLPFTGAVIFAICAMILFLLLFLAIMGYISSFSEAYLLTRPRRRVLYG